MLSLWRQVTTGIRRECAVARASTVLFVETDAGSGERYVDWLEHDFDVRVVTPPLNPAAVAEGDVALVFASRTADATSLVDRLRATDGECPVATVADDPHAPPTARADRHLAAPKSRHDLRRSVEQLLRLRASMSWSRTNARSLHRWSL